MESRFHKYLCIRNTSNSINQEGKLDKYYLLVFHNSIMYTSYSLDLCMKYKMDNIIVQRHEYFLMKPILNLHQKMQISYCQKFNLYLLLIEQQNLLFQPQKDENHKIQLSLKKLMEKYRNIDKKINLMQITNFEMTMYLENINLQTSSIHP
ncbi:unnamed protein product [Paramecium sonneborni]|uniref:Uncharacterized protein n=1 Tax=Paramecium sonneborni TaxID=65129 RepID=A0A8S1PI26_9CILI|nr:unnamed protein product [Paramecium sonneborni]